MNTSRHSEDAAAKRQAKWRIYDDYRQLLDQKDIDGVIVGTNDHARVLCAIHAVQAGKDGCVRLINLADMSGQGAPAHTGGELDAKDLPGGSNCASGNDGPEIKPQPAVWVNPADSSSWIYVTSYSNGSAAYKIALTAGKPSLQLQWPKAMATFPSGTSPVAANGVVYYMSGNHLVALDAVTGASRSAGSAWATTSFSSQHWQSPILVNGRLYLFNDASPAQLWVFELDGAFKGGFE